MLKNTKLDDIFIKIGESLRSNMEQMYNFIHKAFNNIPGTISFMQESIIEHWRNYLNSLGMTSNNALPKDFEFDKLSFFEKIGTYIYMFLVDTRAFFIENAHFILPLILILAILAIKNRPTTKNMY